MSELSDLEWVHERAPTRLAVATVPDRRGGGPPRGPAWDRGGPEPVRVEALGFPDDPLFDQQWNLRAIGVARGWRAGGAGGSRWRSSTPA